MMWLEKLKQRVDFDEKVIQEFEDRKVEGPPIYGVHNTSFQAFVKNIISLGETLEDVEQLIQGDNYYTAYNFLEDFSFKDYDFNEVEKELSGEFNSQEMRKFENINNNFEELKFKASKELIEKALEKGKKINRNREPNILIREKSLKKAFNHVKEEGQGQEVKEVAGVFIMSSEGKGKIICQDYRRLNQEEITKNDEAEISYEDSFLEKYSDTENYKYALMHSHPAEHHNYMIAFRPSDGDLNFFSEYQSKLNFIITTSDENLPSELYISAITMESENIFNFEDITVVNSDGRVEIDCINTYNNLTYLSECAGMENIKIDESIKRMDSNLRKQVLGF